MRLDPKYPDIHVPLTGEDGNAFVIIGRVRGHMKDSGLSAEEINDFANEAMSGDYTHVLQTVMKWVNVS